MPGMVDARMQQSSSQPQLKFDADRGRMAQLGLTERDVTNAMATALAGTSRRRPISGSNPKNGVSYNMQAQTPEYELDSLEALHNLPVTAPTAAPAGAGRPGTISPANRLAAVVTHYNILPTIDLYATTQDRDLGAVAGDVQKVSTPTANICPAAPPSPCAARS